jgi:plasmid stabilization system protein ParE
VSFKIHVTARAERDIQAFHDVVAIRKMQPLNAARWAVGLHRAIETLSENPLRCKAAPEGELFGQDIHQLLHKAHRVLFVVEGDVVEVLHVRHGKREPGLGDEEP